MYSFFYIPLLVLSLLVFTSTVADAQTWKPLGISEESRASSGQIFYSDITTGPDGSFYTVCIESSPEYRFFVKKFNGTEWEVIATQSFGTSSITDCKIAVGPDGTIYVAYIVSSNVIQVKKFQEGEWSNLEYKGYGYWLSMAVGPDGTPYIAHVSNYYSGWSPNIHHFAEGKWQNLGSNTAFLNLVGAKASYNSLTVSKQGEVYLAFCNSSSKPAMVKYDGSNWSKVGSDLPTTGVAKEISCAISQDGIPYVTFCDGANSNKAKVFKFNDGTWSTQGANDLTIGEAASNKICLFPDGTPVFSAIDNGNSKKTVVRKLIGNTWSAIESPALSPGASGRSTMAINKAGELMVIYYDEEMGYRMAAKHLVNNTWTSAGVNGVSREGVVEHQMALGPDDEPYVIYSDKALLKKISIKRYSSGSWNLIGSEGVTSGDTRYIDIAVSSDNVPYIVYKEASNYNYLVVKKFNGSAWVSVGSPIYTESFLSPTSLDIDSKGELYLSYINNKKIQVKKLSAGTWASVGSMTLTDVSQIEFKLGPNDVPYIAYIQTYTATPGLIRFDGTNWVNVVGPGYDLYNTPSALSFAISPDGVPHIAYTDNLNSGKVVVKKLNGTAWESITAGSVSIYSSSYICINFSADGTLYLSSSESSTLRMLVRKVENDKWVLAGNGYPIWNSAENAKLLVNSKGEVLASFQSPRLFVSILSSDDNGLQAPVISSLSSFKGTAKSTIIIKGFNFKGASSVSFGGVEAESFNVESATQISAVPGKGASGEIKVITAAGSGVYKGFIYTTPVPRITSFTPHTGAPGAVVSIKGENFNAIPDSNIVYFGSVKGEVISAASDLITVKVPTGATHAPLLLICNQLTAQTSLPFLPSMKSAVSKVVLTPVGEFACGNEPLSIASGDLNGDGKPDLIVSNYYYPSTISIFKNTSVNGSVSFAPKIDYSGSNSNGRVCVSDMDGDGKLDVILNSYSDKVVVYKNIGNNSDIALEGPILYSSASFPLDISVTDFDGDGRQDVLSLSRDNYCFSLLRNIGIYRNYIAMERADFPLGSSRFVFLTGDLDGDLKPDVINLSTGSWSPLTSIEIYKNNSLYRSAAVKGPFYISSTATGNNLFIDMNNDGRGDIVQVETNKMTVRLNNSTVGAISLSDPLNFKGSALASRVVSGDLNGDGKADFVTINTSDNSFSYILNSGTSANLSFNTPVTINQKNLPTDACIVDLNADEKPDLVITNRLGNSITVLKNESEGVLPLNLLSFTGKRLFETNGLKWVTTDEKNTKAFKVERSLDGKSFEFIGEVKASGNTSGEKSYFFEDKNPLPGSNYYRLNMLDQDFTARYSDIITLDGNKESANLNLYPNPVSTELIVDHQGLSGGQIQIFSLNGKLVKEFNIVSNASRSILDCRDLSIGIYVVKLVSGEKIADSRFIIKR